MGCLKKYCCKTSLVPTFLWIGGYYLYQLTMFRGIGQSQIAFSYSDTECLKKSSFVRNWHGPCPELTAFFGNVKNNICSAKYNFRKIFCKCHRVYCKHRKTTLISKMFLSLNSTGKNKHFWPSFCAKFG